MGRRSSALFSLIAAIFCASGILSAGMNDTGASASVDNFLLPIYSNDALTYILYGLRASNRGAMLTLEWPLIDMVESDLPENAEVRNKTELLPVQGKRNRVALYPINAEQQEKDRFWRRYPYSRALLLAVSAEYNKTREEFKGNSRVYLRSHGIDVDGESFEAFVLENDTKKSMAEKPWIIRIRGNQTYQVQIRIRPKLLRKKQNDNRKVDSK